MVHVLTIQTKRLGTCLNTFVIRKYILVIKIVTDINFKYYRFYDSDAAFAVLACLCYERLAYLPGFSKYAKEIVADTKYCLGLNI